MIDPQPTPDPASPSPADPAPGSLVPSTPSATDASSAASVRDDLFDPQRLEAQDDALWHGKRIAELSDSELAAALAGDVEEPAEPPPVRSAANWRKLAVTWPEPRVSVTLRLDESVVAWFRRSGRDHRARMNAVLRAYVDAQRAEEEKRRR